MTPDNFREFQQSPVGKRIAEIAAENPPVSSDQVKRGSIHRWPGEESVDLYPGLVVSDGDHSRVSGSITLGRSRLPAWCLALDFDLAATGHEYAREDYGVAEADLVGFVRNLLDQRGEFARLLLVIADAERCEGSHWPARCWWETKRHRKRIRAQLERCIAVIDAQEPGAVDEEQA